MESKLKGVLLRYFVVLGLIGSLWSSAAYAQQLHSFTHEELEDHRQENVVRNMHFADDVLKGKFLEVYVPYQESLFKVDKKIRDLTSQYLGDQAEGKMLSPAQAREILSRGMEVQHERNEILRTYIERLRRAVPADVALRAWEVENKLRAEASALYLKDIPFVTQRGILNDGRGGLRRANSPRLLNRRSAPTEMGPLGLIASTKWIWLR